MTLACAGFILLCLVVVACGRCALVTMTLNFNTSLDTTGKGLNESVQIEAATGILLSPASIPPSTTNQPYPLTWTIANVQAIVLVSNVSITVKTNNATTPSETVNLTANIPYIWFVGSPLANLFTHDLTGGLFLTNATAAQARLQGQILTN
ncbi:MAG TPA: hypothetical protein VKB78_16660 [Pirellulales bacterium]|nr:hypothetical protein [Pirellulales bacterium]